MARSPGAFAGPAVDPAGYGALVQVAAGEADSRGCPTCLQLQLYSEDGAAFGFCSVGANVSSGSFRILWL